MASFFGPDSGLYKAISWIGALVVINLCWLVTGLPVVTVGAGLCAVFASCISLIAGDRVWRSFFRAFLAAFPTATLAWLFDLVVAALIGWEWVVSGQLAAPALMFGFRALLLVAALILLMVNVWFFPLLARRVHNGEKTELSDLPRIAKAAVLAAFRYLPRTGLGVLIWAVPVVVSLFSMQIAARLIIVMSVFGLAFCAYLVTLLLHPWVAPEALSDEDE